MAYTNGNANGISNGLNGHANSGDEYFIGKNVFITGVGKGIGHALAKAMARHGANVYGLSENKELLEKLEQEEPRIKTVCADLTDWDQTRAALEAIDVVFDCLVNNAGVTVLEPFLKVSKKALDLIFDVNVKAIINVSQIIAQKMVENGVEGSIVNLSSQASLVALPEHTVYCGSKSAVDGFTRVMAMELGNHNIRVNSINPTVVMTDMGRKVWVGEKAEKALQRICLHKFAEESDIVESVMFLLNNQKARMITGHSMPVDGGFTAC